MMLNSSSMRRAGVAGFAASAANVSVGSAMVAAALAWVVSVGCDGVKSADSKAKALSGATRANAGGTSGL
jgi:hypothetical protein